MRQDEHGITQPSGRVFVVFSNRASRELAIRKLLNDRDANIGMFLSQIKFLRWSRKGGGLNIQYGDENAVRQRRNDLL